MLCKTAPYRKSAVQKETAAPSRSLSVSQIHKENISTFHQRMEAKATEIVSQQLQSANPWSDFLRWYQTCTIVRYLQNYQYYISWNHKSSFVPAAECSVVPG
ncbi:hypothetical protein RRG08_039765 [Elysia crispata]|uniref:Uncharacterized protein n=1 Tax=Elysia crispata TaxID=231223 RepID=A0AAE1DMJ6_9GAST|nr:hypothetical protein RRG08_039765 [Elysia crispata]